MAKSSMRGKYFAFTDYTKTENPENYPSFSADKPVYAIWQLEKAPKTGALHRQGFISFAKAEVSSTVQQILGSEVHLERCRNMQAS